MFFEAPIPAAATAFDLAWAAVFIVASFHEPRAVDLDSLLASMHPVVISRSRALPLMRPQTVQFPSWRTKWVICISISGNSIC
jgi:hypothetical protein